MGDCSRGQCGLRCQHGRCAGSLELIGNYKNPGREWHSKNTPEHVNVYDFVDPNAGSATPYGVFDIALNKGMVSIGKSFDTARFAVNAVRQWYKTSGKNTYAKAQGILLTADGGGSNGSHVRLWKIALQELANEIGVPITVCHYPPGTSKWNPIEHKMFSHISIDWRGKPLRTFDDLVQVDRTRDSGRDICGFGERCRHRMADDRLYNCAGASTCGRIAQG